jgi:hypothetical protein
LNIKGVKPLHWFGINAIVFYPFVLYADEEINPVILKHEEIHLQQIRRDGILAFYVRYLREYLSLRKQGMNHHAAYRGISYEQEAYAFQKFPEYLVAETDDENS